MRETLKREPSGACTSDFRDWIGIGRKRNPGPRFQDPKGDLLRYTVIVEKGRESGFVAICPALPGCVSQGRTKHDVLRNIREAIEVYIKTLLEDGLPVPVEQGREMIGIEVEGKAVRILRGEEPGRNGQRLVERMRKRATAGLSTEEIMALTRQEG